MRFVVIALLVSLLIAVTPASAQSTYTSGNVYQFEDTVAGMVYSGTWSSGSLLGMAVRSTTTSGGYVSFYVTGKTLIVWRLMRSDTTASMEVCYGVSSTVCVVGASTTTASSSFSYPLVVPLPGGTNLVTIYRSAGVAVINLDYFMILDDTPFSPVPTATILPSSTPAPTATPMNTPVNTATPMNTPVNTPTAAPSVTPAPTATPYTLPDAIIAISPNTSYQTVGGQIVAIEYRFTAGEVAIALLLGLLGLLGFMFLVIKMGER